MRYSKRFVQPGHPGGSPSGFPKHERIEWVNNHTIRVTNDTLWVNNDTLWVTNDTALGQ